MPRLLTIAALIEAVTRGIRAEIRPHSDRSGGRVEALARRQLCLLPALRDGIALHRRLADRWLRRDCVHRLRSCERCRSKACEQQHSRSTDDGLHIDLHSKEPAIAAAPATQGIRKGRGRRRGIVQWDQAMLWNSNSPGYLVLLDASPLMRSGQLIVNPPISPSPYRKCRRIFWPESELNLSSGSYSRMSQVSEVFYFRRRRACKKAGSPRPAGIPGRRSRRHDSPATGRAPAAASGRGYSRSSRSGGGPRQRGTGRGGRARRRNTGSRRGPNSRARTRS